ncbi:hypothetical protein LCGC14_1511960, partial [marine sediment metagenome]
MTRVLLLGPNGMLGTAIREAAPDDIEVVPWEGRFAMNITHDAVVTVWPDGLDAIINTIGPRNVISDNLRGVQISHTGTTGNVVRGNLIGTNLTGSAGVPNARCAFQPACRPGRSAMRSATICIHRQENGNRGFPLGNRNCFALAGAVGEARDTTSGRQDGPGRRSKRRRLLIFAVALSMVFIVGVWVLTARYGRGERYRVEARYTWFPGGSGHFSAPSTSASGVLPGVIARKAVFVVSVFRQRGAIAVDPHVLKADRTVSRMRLGLTHALWRRKLGGTIRHVWLTLTGVGAAAEQEDYRVTVLAE